MSTIAAAIDSAVPLGAALTLDDRVLLIWGLYVFLACGWDVLTWPPKQLHRSHAGPSLPGCTYLLLIPEGDIMAKGRKWPGRYSVSLFSIQQNVTQAFHPLRTGTYIHLAPGKTLVPCTRGALFYPPCQPRHYTNMKHVYEYIACTDISI